jgi:hypothetical protein
MLASHSGCEFPSGNMRGVSEMLRHLYGLVWCLVLIPGSAIFADVSAEIARIEQSPRSQRLAEYETLANRKSLSDADRTKVVQAFAKHASKVSPTFGKSSHTIDSRRWQIMLEYALKRESRDQDVLFSLCQLLIDEGKHAEALPFAAAFLDAYPEDHFAKAWSEYCQLKASARAARQSALLTFPLHFCVLSRNPKAHQHATLKLCRQEVDIFNRSFVTLEGKPLVRFVFKGYRSFDEVKGSRSELLQWGDSTAPYSNDRLTKAFNACDDSAVRDPSAINVYVYDSHSEKSGFGDQTSHGIRNSNRPFVVIDWERLGGNIQNAEPHEMGHAFGLGHVGVPGATTKSSTNIMASVAEGFGSGGERDLGFSESQAAVILYHAERTHSRLGLR